MRKISTIRIKDEVNCVVLGLRKKDADYLWDLYKERVPNYNFHPKFQMGQWDGYLRFFYKTGITYVYLLEDIVPRLINLGYAIKLSDKRKNANVTPEPIDENFFSDIINEATGEPWVIRDYQVELVNTLLEEGSGIAVAGTGSGKTSCCAALAKSYEKAGNLRTMIIVPDKNLTAQTFREYQYFGLDVGQYGGDIKDYEHQHVVSTWQSLNNNKTLIQYFDVVIVDECLDGDTNITMSDGTTKPIKKIKKNDIIISYNKNKNLFETDLVEKVHKNLMLSSNEKMYELEFDNGIKIKVTGNHKILTNRGYVRSDKLTEKDEIISYKSEG
jgi:hypothetical protein